MKIDDVPKDKKIILFDGVCNLCDSAVQFVIKQDNKDRFRFVTLQSELGQTILKHIGVDPFTIDGIVLYEPGIAYYYKSNAALTIAKELSGIVTLLTVFQLIPEKINNIIYDYVARNRYKWYGTKENCDLVSEALKHKFLE
jgi:predicted DCC family thiol-disulfide oxidoreductase YuxK